MADQLEIEKKWQRLWKEEKAFVPKIGDAPKFFGTVPYPYANSILHIGHGRMFTAADIVLRFQRLKGNNVLFPIGFHISGTPVLAVSDGIASKDPVQLERSLTSVGEYIQDKAKVKEIVSSFVDPMKVADFYSSTMEATFDSVGISMDWSKVFSTGDEGYKRFIQWQYHQLEKAGVLVQGKYPILYSAEDESAVGEDDIKDGDTDKVTIQEMTYILFKVDDCYIAVATLRPDALFGTTNLWIDPNMDVMKVQVGEQVWLLAKDSMQKVTHQFDNVKVLSEHKGSEFIGKTALAPIIDREVPIIEADFIDPEMGTGLVYSSPGGSPHDFLAMKAAQAAGKMDASIQVINTVHTKDKKGKPIEYDGECPAHAIVKKMGITDVHDPKVEDAKQALYKEEHYGGVLNEVCGDYNGVPIKKAKERLLQELMEKNVGGILYEASRKARTRAGNHVIVANLHGQWFLDYSAPETKEKAYSVLDGMSYLPANLRESQKGYLEWVQKRPCARKRGIGTPLPQEKEWIVEPLSDSTIYQLYYPIAQFVNEGKIKPEELTDEIFTYLFLGKGSPSHPALEDMKAATDYWKGFDFRMTAATHMSNHLSFLIYHYGLLLPEKFHPKNITIGGLLIREGVKVSKSKGNGLPLINVREKYGADLYRLYIAVGTSFDAEFDFRDDDIFQLRKKFDRWKELMFAAKAVEKKNYDSFSSIDKWLISRFYSHSKEFMSFMDENKFREAYVEVLFEFLSEIQFHTRRTSEEETSAVLRFVFEDYVKLMAPAVPHVCEELYEGIGSGFVSLASFSTEADTFIDTNVEAIEGITQELTRNIASVQKQKGMESLSKISIVQAPSVKFQLFDTIAKELAKSKEFKVLLPKLKDAFPNEMKFITKFVPKTLSSGLQFYLPKEEEKKYLESIVDFLASEFSCSVAVVDADTLEKAPGALPGSPGILLE